MVIGEWRSLVAHLLWEQRVAGSNPVSPTILTHSQFRDWRHGSPVNSLANYLFSVALAWLLPSSLSPVLLLTLSLVFLTSLPMSAATF
jgi:hypothetical protein